MSGRGQPKRPRYNVRTSCEDVEQQSASSPFPSDSFDDGKGIDYRLPIPPWNAHDLNTITRNLARLRVDPKHTNHSADNMESAVLAIAGLEHERYEHDCYNLGNQMIELLSARNHDAASEIFNDMLRMIKFAADPPHRNFFAYRAYCDFLTEFGHQPTMPRLTSFIKERSAVYPVGISSGTGSKEWWQMYFESGLVRLVE